MDVGEQFAQELGRVFRGWRKRLDERLKELDLSQARWVVLLNLSQTGPISQRELAERIGVEGPSMVRMLDNLERQNLVERMSCEHDRRIKLIQLTSAAEPLIKEIRRIANTVRTELLADVPMAQLREALIILKSVGDRLENK